MADPTHRFDFAGTSVDSQVESIDGQILFFIDLHIEDGVTVSVGWDSSRSKFGVYVNGNLVHPVPAVDTIDTASTATTEGDADHGS